MASNLLDGNGDGTPGGDYLKVFHGAGLFPAPTPSGFGKGPDAFVTTQYNEVLGRTPEPAGLAFWSKQLASRVKPVTVATAIWNSPERHGLQHHGKAPAISFGHAMLDAKAAWRQAVKVSDAHPKFKSVVAPFSSKAVSAVH